MLGWPEKNREVLQELGAWVCERDPYRFPNLMLETAEELNGWSTWAICDDLRRPAEYDMLKASGWLMVRLDVSPNTQIARGAEADRLEHSTETGLDDIPKEEWDLWIPEKTTVYERVQLVREALSESTLKPPVLTLG